MQHYPIIYVRGYAMRQKDVEETVDDPFCGFNLGSTHVRVGTEGNAEFFGFESPLVRLMTDPLLSYSDAYNSGIQQLRKGMNRDEKKRTIWIYRFYDPTSKTFHNSRKIRLSIEEIAAGLAEKITKIKFETGAKLVYLIAHSLGGLICRSLIQKYYPENGQKADEHIAKLFTYGTPHGGIHFDITCGGAVEWVRDFIGWHNSDDFGPERMYQYLTAYPEENVPDDFDSRSLQGKFPESKVFCLIGTNAHDYEMTSGGRTIGALSDGLVQTASAYVKGSSRAYVHRSHSGRYGIVNSEEGYQNLVRFLFGSVKVEIFLTDVNIRKKANTTYYVNLSVAIRGLPVLMHEQTQRNLCPIKITQECQDRIPLYTSFLMPEKSTEGGSISRFSIDISIRSEESRKGVFSFRNHLENVSRWSDTLIVDVVPEKNPEDGFIAYSAWVSEGGTLDQRNPIIPLSNTDDKARLYVALPPAGRKVAGDKAGLTFDTSFLE